MSHELIITEILFLIIMVIGSVVAWEFYRSKNGILRKLMLWYFCIDIYIYGASAVYFGMAETGYPVMSIIAFRFCVLIPKAIIKLRIVYYLRTKK